ncbi:MAG: nitrite reductase, copper-containing [Veillonella sp.]|nr:nitrite reductase, copper-containing [Veillonella sp.]
MLQKLKSLKKKQIIPVVIGLVCAIAIGGYAAKAFTQKAQGGAHSRLPVVQAELTTAPNVPKPIDRDYPARVVVNLEVQQKVMPITKGVDYKFWTYNGSTPGPFIRVREGDEVEIHLKNPPTERMPHSIDFHAVTGEMGGVEATQAMPNTETTTVFTAMKPGLYLYHCGSMPNPGVHIAKGMFGLILVEPKDGLPKVDREYFMIQNEFYVNENGDDPHSDVSQKVATNNQKLVTLDMQKAMAENPDYVVFNGQEGSMSGEHALKAKVGDKVRLFVGNAGPNLASSFHIMGKTLDVVRVEGGSLENHDVQTTLIPPGSATIIDLTMTTPGEYMFLDHSIMRTMKGASGDIFVTGRQDPAIFTGQTAVKPYTKSE